MSLLPALCWKAGRPSRAVSGLLSNHESVQKLDSNTIGTYIKASRALWRESRVTGEAGRGQEE
jgi:hypothetical protein